MREKHFQKKKKKKKNSGNWAKCDKKDTFLDRFSLKQGQLSLPELPKRGAVKIFHAAHPGTKIEGVPPGSDAN